MSALEGIKARAAGHAPGPWEVRSDSHPYRGGRFVHVEPLHGSRTICDLTDAHEANAELIAAAPKLLAALEAVGRLAVGWHDAYQYSASEANDIRDDAAYEVEQAIAEALA